MGPERPDGHGINPLVAAASIGLFALAASALVDAGYSVAAPAVDLLLATLASVLAFGVALLAAARSRARDDAMPLFQAAAFGVLCVSSVATLYVHLTGPAAGPSTPADQVFLQFLLGSVTPLLAGVLLAVGGLAAVRAVRPTHVHPLALGLLVGVFTVLVVREIASPQLTGLRSGATIPAPALGQGVPFDLTAVMHMAAAIAFVIAGSLTFVNYRRHAHIADGYVVVALTFATFAQIHVATGVPNPVGVVTTNDLVRVAFYTVLLAGLTAEVRQTFASLREANVSLAVLRGAELERAAMEERTRLSRELHDGLAQSLWIAKMKATRLQRDDLDADVRELGSELTAAIDASLAEARYVVMALRITGEASFAELMATYVEDFSDSFGLRAEFVCDGDLPRLEPRAEAELLRITQEALNNARRHADATLVRVEAHVRGGKLRVVVTDNGRGFRTRASRTRGFGITSMRERAAIIGGMVTIASRPQDGTRVSVEVPLGAAAPATATAP